MFKIKKSIGRLYIFLRSLPFRLRYRSTFVLGKNCIIHKCKVYNPQKGKVIVGDNCSLINCRFHFEEGKNRVVISNGVKLNGAEFIERYGGDNLISIGENTTTGVCQFEASEGASLCIGEDCMFSYNVNVWAAAHHSILDSNGNRINCVKSIRIGNHCWIGHSSFIMKGSIVPDGSIVGAATYIQENMQVKNLFMLVAQQKK